MRAKPILLGLGAFLAFKFISKSSAASKLGFYVAKVSLRFSGFTPILDITMGIQNPTGTTINLGSIVGDLFINGNYVANLSGYQLTQIKAASVTLYPLSARLSIAGLYGEVKDIIDNLTTGNTNAILNQTLSFKGNVYAEGVTLPLKFSYKVL